jgi:dihydrofolate reductase
VFSRTLEKADWNTRIIGANLAEEVTAMKRQPGKDLLLTGGVGLAATLTGLGLIDEYQVVVHPVVLGGGKRLFAGVEERLELRLVESRTFDSQAVLLRYRRADRDR